MAIDPLSLIPLFAVLTAELDSKKTLNLSFLVFIITSTVLTFFSLFGNKFLLFMGISIYSFQIIGGVFLLFISYEMVFEKRLTRKKNVAKKIIDENEVKNNSVSIRRHHGDDLGEMKIEEFVDIIKKEISECIPKFNIN